MVFNLHIIDEALMYNLNNLNIKVLVRVDRRPNTLWLCIPRSHFSFTHIFTRNKEQSLKHAFHQ